MIFLYKVDFPEAGIVIPTKTQTFLIIFSLLFYY